tara:strand:- start:2868 stop:4403 length:1536 start_codon:yes stop_codon:yes gene_type:complete
MLNKLDLKNIQFILLALLPLAFVVGPLIVESIVNILNVIFLFNVFKNKNFGFLKSKLFIFLILFYLILILSLFQSDYFNETKINVLFYFRFILFPFAVYEILKTNSNYLKYLFISLMITVFIVSIDGYVQFFYGKNLLGFEKYRVDRISGFFNDDLILGSYLSRVLILLIGLAFYFKDNIKLNKISILIISFCVLLIFLTGERAAFLKTIFGLVIIFLVTNIRWSIKISSLAIFITSFLLVILINPIIFDRYINQLKSHIFQKDIKNGQYIFMSNYSPMFQTSLKMFNNSKIIGKGPKSYRYHCNDPEFKSFFLNRFKTVDNTILSIDLSWKNKGLIQVKEIFISKNDLIKKGDQLFSYSFLGSQNTFIYQSDKEGIVKEIYEKNVYDKNDIFLRLDPQNLPDKEIFKISACNTHPHNFYFQLLAEVGLVGFVFVFSLFLYISFILIKNFVLLIKKSPKKKSDSELVLLIGFFIALWPLTTNGNFFNNWINLINFYPLGIYFFLKKNSNNE